MCTWSILFSVLFLKDLELHGELPQFLVLKNQEVYDLVPGHCFVLFLYSNYNLNIATNGRRAWCQDIILTD